MAISHPANQFTPPAASAGSPTRRRFVQRATSAAALVALATLRPLELLASAAEAATPTNPPSDRLPSAGPSPQPFKINVAQAELDDLQARLARTRWPDEVAGAGWDYGANREYLQGLTAYWQKGYDWRAQEAQLNEFPQFMAEVEGFDLHFIHIEGKGPNPMPLLLTHGWPDSLFRFVKLLPLLTDPASHGGQAEDAFTVVVPDIPGFGFSAKPTQPGCDTTRTAALFARLMTQVLGYPKFAAHGGDFGASITEQLGLHYAEVLFAIHLNNVPPQHAQHLEPEGLSAVEQAYLKTVKEWGKREGAFTQINDTKPQTLSYGLNDSPVGLAAWLIEKFHTWSDCHGALERVFTKDELLTNVMIYWVTQTIGSSVRFYYEKAHRPAAPEPTRVAVPTGFASFINDIIPAPRPFAERFFNVQRWTEMPQGGHFAALEVPDALAGQLREFFRAYRPER